MTPYEENDKVRKDYHDWLKSRIDMVRNDSHQVDKRIFTLVDALLNEVNFLSTDFSDRTKTLLEQTNFLWTYTRVMGDAVIFLTKKAKEIEPLADQLKKVEDQQKSILSMKENIDSQVKKRAEEIQRQIEEQKTKINKDLPGVS